MNNSDDLDPRVQQLYRQLVKEQPSPELDAKILAAAQQAIKKPSRWFMPFSMPNSIPSASPSCFAVSMEFLISLYAFLLASYSRIS